jgi:hypothetical protein
MKQRRRRGSISDHKRTNYHSGVEQEWGPDSQQKDSMPQLQLKRSISRWKSRTKQNLNLNVAAATEFIPKGGNVLGLRATRWGRPQPGLKTRHDTRPTWPEIGDAAPCCGQTRNSRTSC